MTMHNTPALNGLGYTPERVGRRGVRAVAQQPLPGGSRPAGGGLAPLARYALRVVVRVPVHRRRRAHAVGARHRRADRARPGPGHRLAGHRLRHHRSDRERRAAAGVRDPVPPARRAGAGPDVLPHGRRRGVDAGQPRAGRHADRPLRRAVGRRSARDVAGRAPPRRPRRGRRRLPRRDRRGPPARRLLPDDDGGRPGDLGARHRDRGARRRRPPARLARRDRRRHRDRAVRRGAACRRGPLSQPGRAGAAGHLSGQRRRHRHLCQPAGRGDPRGRGRGVGGQLRRLARPRSPGRPRRRRPPLPGDAHRRGQLRPRVPRRPPRRQRALDARPGTADDGASGRRRADPGRDLRRHRPPPRRAGRRAAGRAAARARRAGAARPLGRRPRPPGARGDRGGGRDPRRLGGGRARADGRRPRRRDRRRHRPDGGRRRRPPPGRGCHRGGLHPDDRGAADQRRPGARDPVSGARRGAAGGDAQPDLRQDRRHAGALRRARRVQHRGARVHRGRGRLPAGDRQHPGHRRRA